MYESDLCFSHLYLPFSHTNIAVVAYASNIESLENLSEAVERICEKHCALQLTPEDYMFVHDNFMESVGEVLGEVVTPEIAAAWSEAIMALANIFIQTEKNLYAVAKEKQWLGVKEFSITDIIDEAIDVKSFRFQAKDNEKSGFVPGQYITIFEKPVDKEYFAPRHYTVTSQPEDNYYEVTVKRLVDPADPNNSAHDGFYSNYLHSVSKRDFFIVSICPSSCIRRTHVLLLQLKVGDTIHCGAIYGPDLLSAGDKSRVAAFVSVGIGITPTKAMLQLAKATRPSIAVFHGNSDKEHQAFKGLEEEVKQAGGIFTACYSYIKDGERLTGKKIVDTLKSSGIGGSDKVDFYICAGNASVCLSEQLVAAGIKRECIHLEYFGPFQSPPEEES